MDAKTLCLGALMRGAASGYEIRKMFEEGPFAHFHETSFGSVYPALKALQDEKLVTVQEQPQDSRPDKKVYSLTEGGIRKLLAALHQEPQPDRVRSDLMFILFFGQHLPTDHLERLIDDRIAFYRESIERMEPGSACMEGVELTPGEAFVRDFGLVIYRTAADFLAKRKQDLLRHAKDQRPAAE